jgi:predicted RNase H-like HicB family nuclease
MPVHHEVLRAALRICRGRDDWRFRPLEIVRALPHLDPGTVRTHIVSRCCVNAPANHPHRWEYFRRISRGVYEIRPPYRRHERRPRTVAESPANYGKARKGPRRDTVHAVVARSGGWYFAECLEVAVVTQGRTLDDLVANLEEAIALHLDGEDAAAIGLVSHPRLSVTYELPTQSG